MSSSDDDMPNKPIKYVKRKRRRIPSQEIQQEPLGLYSQKVVPKLIKINEELQQKFYCGKEGVTQVVEELVVSDHDVSAYEPVPAIDLTRDDIQIVGEGSPLKAGQLTPPCKQKIVEPKQTKAVERKRQQLLRNVASVLSSAKIEGELNQSVDGSAEDQLSESNLQTVVKVRFQSAIQKFHCRKGDTFADIFEQLASRAKTSCRHLLMTLNDRTITSSDTPLSIGLSAADIIDCVVFDRETLNLARNICNRVDCITIQFQCKFEKAKKSYSVNKYEPLRETLQAYADAIGYTLKTLSFQFDGDVIDASSTPKELELETGFCIDVMRKTKKH